MTPLELGSQPLSSSGTDQKKRPLIREPPHRVDAVVLLKILFLARVIDPLRQKRGEFTPSGLDIKHFHFMLWINAFYGQRSERQLRGL